jgi:SET domain-containing protein
MKCKFQRVRLEMGCSAISGIGVFAVSDIHKGKRVAEGIHESDYSLLISWSDIDECDSAIRNKIFSFCVGSPQGFIPPDNLDFNTLSVEWYMNHSCEGNVGFNRQGDFIARRDVKKGEELTYDYGLAESNPGFKMTCKCKSKNCRKTITGNDWKDEIFRATNLPYMLPKLRMAR